MHCGLASLVYVQVLPVLARAVRTWRPKQQSCVKQINVVIISAESLPATLFEARSWSRHKLINHQGRLFPSLVFSAEFLLAMPSRSRLWSYCDFATDSEKVFDLVFFSLATPYIN